MAKRAVRIQRRNVAGNRDGLRVFVRCGRIAAAFEKRIAFALNQLRSDLVLCDAF